MGKDLSIVIPARNELFLKRTIVDILSNIEGDTEIIVVLDGQLPLEPLPIHERLKVVYYQESVGQRGAINQGVRLSQAKFIMKSDAHCSFDKGFDVKLMEDCEYDWTVVPKMYNLHAFDWVCDKGHRRYQGPSGDCEECGAPTHREYVWKAKSSPESTSMRFDHELRFQYWSDFKKHQEGDLVETMSLLGACFFMHRQRFWDLDGCDEGHGSWGQQGTEVACKAWLSGGKLICNKKTWFAHMFRTQGGDFGFPYDISGNDVQKARRYSNDFWKGNKWDKAIHNLEWLVNRFAPVPDWHLTAGAIYYTDNRHDPRILKACQKQLEKSFGGRIVSISLKPIDFAENIHLDLERGAQTMFKQILAGLERLDTDIVFFCESDVLYHPTHFEFVPQRSDKYYYNTNVWKVDFETGKAMRTASCQQTSGLCGYRETLLEHYRERVRRVEKDGFSRAMGFEPGTHGREERVDDIPAESWESPYPNVDIRHEKNFTETRWNKEEFRNKRYTEGWQEADSVKGWGDTKELMDNIREDS